jgi:uncharacterized protein (TIGR02266 family)
VHKLKSLLNQPAAPAGQSERRQQPRLPVDVDVTVQTAEEVMNHPAVNISTGGMYLEIDQPLPENTNLQLRFTLPDSGRLITLEGKVIWSREAGREDRYATGIRFTGVDEGDLDTIRKYSDKLLQAIKKS